MTLPIMSKLLFMYVLFYLYATVGAYAFGGEINKWMVYSKSPASPPLYYLLNFNTYGASLMTLFHFMVVNNWFITIDMYEAVTDDSLLPTLFFVTFWAFITLELLNVLIALILEVYSSVEPEVAE